MPSLGNLVVHMKANTTDFARGMTSGQKRITTFKTSAIAGFAAVGVAGAGMAAVFKSKILPQFEALDKIAKLSQNTGFKTGDLLAYGFAAEQTGVAAQSLNDGLQRMQRTIGEARAGSAAAAAAFADIGVSLESLRSNSADQNLMQIADAFAAMTTAEERAAAANRLFGRSGKDLLNFLNEGSQGLRAFKSEAAGLGILFSAEELAKVEAANDAMNRLNRTTDAMWQKIAVQAAPAIEQMADSLAALASDAETVRGVGIAVGELGQSLVVVADKFNWMWQKGRMAAEATIVLTMQLREALGNLPKGATDEFIRMRKEMEKVELKKLEPPAMPVQPPERSIVPVVQHFTGLMQQGVKAYADSWRVKMQANQEQLQKQQEQHLSNQQRAALIVAQNMTPKERFDKAYEALGDLRLGGFLSEVQADRELARLKSELRESTAASKVAPEVPEVRFAGSLQQGSAEAYSAIVAAFRESQTARKKSAEAKAIEKNTKSIVKAIKGQKTGPELVTQGAF